MTFEDSVALLERFQTSIVGLIGFLGVMFTLFMTSRSAKSAHQREVATRRNALRRILAAELENYARALRSNTSQAKPEEEFGSVGRLRRLYSDQLSADLGLLNPHEIDIVMNALISLAGMDRFLSHISSQRSDTEFFISALAWEDFQAINSTTADALDYAVQALNSQKN